MPNLIKLFKQKYAGLREELSVRSYIEGRFPGTLIEDGVQIKGDIENLKLGKNVLIQKGTVINLGGFEWCGNAGSLEIGDDSVISPHCVIYAAGPGGVKIGKHFECGPGVGIYANRTDYNRGSGAGNERHIFRPVEIGDNVIVFANAVIGPGVKIGDGAAIAACSAVTRDVPAHSLAGGSPAKVLRSPIN